jgi:hypothetical protein
MRLPVFFAALCLAIVPAHAAQSIADQAQSAYDIFAGGQSQKDFLSARYGRSALSGIDGRWARLNGPDNDSGVESYGSETEKACTGPDPVTIKVIAPVALTVETTHGANSILQQYSLIAGSTFAEHTDLASYFVAIGLGPEKVGTAYDQQRALALAIVNGIVQIYHPSPDILVMTRDRGYPIVYSRCPASSSASAAE